MPAAPAGGATAVQDTALNGAQVASLLEVVSAVVAKQLPPESAKALLMAAFPRITPEQVNGIVDPAASFTPALTPEQEAAKLKAEQPTVVASGPPKKPGGEV